MIDVFNNSLLLGSILLLASVILSKTSNKFGVPSLILFLGIGVIVGKDVVGLVNYSSYEMTHSIALIAICIIIFSGGLMTKHEDIKPILASGISLSTFGVLHTTTLVGGFCYLFLDLPFYECLLIGAILSSTDAAAVFTAFKQKDYQVTKKVKSTIEFESGSNDPITYLLVSLFLGLHQANSYTNLDIAKLLILNPIIGFFAGLVVFKVFKYINDNVTLDYEGLYPVLTVSFLFLSYSAATYFNGNGFLAVYVFAVYLGNAKILHKKSLVSFFDGFAWLAQIGLFIMLGLLVSPTRLVEIAPQASVIALFLIFVGRPISIFLSTFNSKFTFNEKLFISWAGLKGASPIVFASLVATQLKVQSNLIFDIVFFTVLFSSLLQGSTIKFVARKLNLMFEVFHDPDFPIDLEVIDKTKNGIKEIVIAQDDFAAGKRIVDLNLPSGTLLLFIKRSSSFIIPNGSTEIEPHDKILIVTPEKSQLQLALERFKEESEEEPLISLVDQSDQKNAA